VEKKPRKSSKDADEDEDEDVIDLEEGKIPESITMDTNSGSYHEEAADVVDVDTANSDTSATASERSSSPDTVSLAMSEAKKAAMTPLPLSPGGPLDVPLSPVANASEGGVSKVETASDLRRTCASEVISPPTTPNASYIEKNELCLPSIPDHLRIPMFEEGEEECKEEDEGEYGAAMLPLPLTRNDSVLSTNFDFIDDDSTDGNVCAICLSGYSELSVVCSLIMSSR